MDPETVWRALASPHRRTLLDLLRDGPCTTGQLAKEFPDLSRFAVMQHLGVLNESGLVLFRREGRRRLNYANPVPLREIYERWVSKPASSAAETALHLKRYSESSMEVALKVDHENFRHIKVETELHINAPRERVYAAMTTEYGNWWPHRYKADSTVTADVRPGGFITEHFKDGGGAVTGTLLYLDPPSKIVGSGPSSLLKGFDNYQVMTFIEQDGGTLLQTSMDIWGDVTEDFEKMFREGQRHFIEVSLANYLEKGIEYSPEES